MNNKKRCFTLIVTGLIAAICIELCLAYFSARRGSILEENIVLVPEYTAGEAADGNPYQTTEDMPWLDFAPGIRAGYLEFEFTEPIPEKMQVLVYYTENSGQEFNRFRRIERWLLRGTTKGIIPLPDVRCEKLRLTLTGAGQIKNVSLNERPAAGPAVRQMLDRVNPLRLLLLAAVLPLSLCLHGAKRRKRAKQSHGRAAGQPGERRQRTAYLDGVRVLAALFVIAVHVVEPVAVTQIKGTPRDFFFQAVVLSVLTCNLLFFFISGALLLPYREETIGQYYRKRVVKIVLPFAVYSLFYLKLLCATGEGTAGWAGEAALSFFGASITMGPHLWLIYKLLALYLLVPFYRLMLAKMPEQMEKLLFAMIAAALAIRTACTYFQFDLGISLYLDSWLGLFLGGYLLNKAWMRKYDIFLAAGGASSLAVSLWIYSFRPDYLEIIANCSILEFLMASAVFVLVLRLNGICSRFSRILETLGKRSFSVLMVHLFVLSAVLPLGFIPVGWENKSIGQMVIPYIFTYVVSYLIAVVVDETIIKVLDAGAGRFLTMRRKMTDA